MWRDEAMWDKVPEPVWYMEDVIVAFFFGHGGHDLVQSAGYGRVVSVMPVEQSISLRGQTNEVVWASHSHDSCALGD